MGSRRVWPKLVAVVAAAAIVAGACGDDDDNTQTAATSGTTSGAATTAAATTTSGGAATTSGGASTSAGGSTGSVAQSSGAGGDSVDGVGAEAFQEALKATESKPLKAEGKPFVIGMANIEGDPSGSWPDIREGTEAAVKLINERLGGIGADVAAGKPGRPIELKYCSHKADQNEAQGCANEIASAKPNTVFIGIDFFTPLMYPLWTQLPVVQMLPIFIADFDQPGVVSPFGGCPTAFPASAEMIAAISKHDKLGVIWSGTAPGQECWRDTQVRFYDYMKDTQPGFQYEGFTFQPGETAGYPAVVQNTANYLKGAKDPAIFLGLDSASCAAFIPQLRGAGVDATIYIADSCNSEAVLKLNESKGIKVELQGYPLGQPDLYSALVAYEMDQREKAIDDYGPKTPLTTYTRQSFSGVVFIYQVASDLARSGGNIDDAETLRKAYMSADKYHVLGYRPVSCANTPPEFESVCAHTATYATWDGSKFTIDPAIPGGVIDVTDLMLKVQEKYPRQ